jgi:hypothetical protein
MSDLTVQKSNLGVLGSLTSAPKSDAFTVSYNDGDYDNAKYYSRTFSAADIAYLRSAPSEAAFVKRIEQLLAKPVWSMMPIVDHAMGCTAADPCADHIGPPITKLHAAALTVAAKLAALDLSPLKMNPPSDKPAFDISLRDPKGAVGVAGAYYSPPASDITTCVDINVPNKPAPWEYQCERNSHGGAGVLVSNIGSGQRVLAQGTSTTLRVRLEAFLRNSVQAGVAVKLSIEGDPHGATLSAATATTDANGEVSFQLSAGTSGRFTVLVDPVNNPNQQAGVFDVWVQ